MDTSRIAILIATIVLLLTTVTYGGEEITIVLNVAQDGSILVTHILKIEKEVEVIKIRALAEPTSEVIAYGEKEPYLTEINCSEGLCDIVVYYPSLGPLNISYIVTTLTSYSGGIWTINFVANATTLIILPEETVPVSIPGDFISIKEKNNRYYISVPPGEHKVEYTLLIKIPEEVKREKKGEPQERESGTLLLFLLPIIMVIVIIIVFFLKRKVSRPKFKDLDETDILILKTVKKKKLLTLSELVRETGLPKTTAYRRINKLAENGYLKIEKRGHKLVIIPV